MSSSSSSSKKKKTKTTKKQRRMQESDNWARALLQETGFDPDNLDKKDNEIGYTPMLYFAEKGNVKMCRYLIARGADCRKSDTYGRCPMFIAAANGHLEMMTLLYQDGDAREDIRTQTRNGLTPLRFALHNDHVAIWKWLIRKGALASRTIEGVMDDATLRKNLRPLDNCSWEEDKRRAILSWAQDAVTAHEHFQLFVTGTPLFSRDDTRTSSSSLSSSLLVRIFHRHQPPDILEVITHYVEDTEQDLRTFHQLLDRLPRFIHHARFVVFVEEGGRLVEEED